MGRLSGTAYSADDPVCYTVASGDLQVLDLYAQWTPVETYSGGNTAGDTLTCEVKPDYHTVNATFDISSVTGSGENVEVLLGLYRGNRLVGVQMQTFTLTASGVVGDLTADFPSGSEPDSYKVMVIGQADSAAKLEPLICTLN